MKKLIICVLMLIGIKQLNAQGLSGSYLGSLTLGSTKLQVIFNVDKAADGIYSSTFDSPDQKAFGIKCSKTTVVKDSLFIEVAQAGILYKGLWDGKGGITGTFKQGGSNLPLNLQLMRRPQTPKPPFNYVSEEVEYDNADKSLHYGATFTRPTGKGKYPAVIIITGSG
ncbi:MAG: hypothetical protein M3O71_18590 [Bacteroidota bacterium]|nr:hypothetical protein [Bacteroidota bacterium]